MPDGSVTSDQSYATRTPSELVRLNTEPSAGHEIVGAGGGLVSVAGVSRLIRVR